MGSYKKKKHGSYSLEAPFVGLSHRMLESPAWLALGYSTAWVYLYMYKAKYETGQNEFPLTYQVIRKIKGMSPTTFSNAIDELVAFGFIEIVRHGGFPLPSLYKISNKWRSIMQSHIRGIKAAIKKRSESEHSIKSTYADENVQNLTDISFSSSREEPNTNSLSEVSNEEKFL